MVFRKPLTQREVTIIRRLKRVIKLPVTKIAAAVDRNKSTVYKALDKSWSPGKRGHPGLLPPGRSQTHTCSEGALQASPGPLGGHDGNSEEKGCM